MPREANALPHPAASSECARRLSWASRCAMALSIPDRPHGVGSPVVALRPRANRSRALRPAARRGVGPASEQYLVYDEGKGKWNDVPLNWGFVDGYIVEFDALPTPEPSTLGLIALPVLAMFYCSVLRRPRT